MSLYLNTEQMRVVEKNERGVVKYRKRYKKGDEVDTDHMDADRVEHLKAKGTLVESEDDLTDWRGRTGPYPGSQITGAATAPSAPHAEIDEGSDDGALDERTLEAPDDEGDQAGEGGASTEGSEADDTEMVDQYSEMDYATLQQAAKSRSLSGAGSAEDLRARLREADNS